MTAPWYPIRPHRERHGTHRNTLATRRSTAFDDSGGTLELPSDPDIDRSVSITTRPLDPIEMRVEERNR